MGTSHRGNLFAGHLVKHRPIRYVDLAWSQIVQASIEDGTRGKVFRMNSSTWKAVCTERGWPDETLRTGLAPMLYGIRVDLSDVYRFGYISLEKW